MFFSGKKKRDGADSTPVHVTEAVTRDQITTPPTAPMAPFDRTASLANTSARMQKLNSKNDAGEDMAAGSTTGSTSHKLNGEPVDQQPDPEMLAKIAEVRSRLHETFGKVALAMMTVPRYRHLPFGDMSALILDPLIRDRIAIATATKDGEPADGTLSGVAIWASVSKEVDAKIIEQIRAGTFPIRLQPNDWNSGSIPWLLDVIAPNPQLTAAVIANFRQVLPKASGTTLKKDGEMRLHPVVTRLVNRETLERLGVRPIDQPAATGET